MPRPVTNLVWFAVNKDGLLVMFCDEPTRDEKLGIWVGKFPFFNVSLRINAFHLAKQAKMTWDSDPECMSFSCT